jgi:hypothetical protein
MKLLGCAIFNFYLSHSFSNDKDKLVLAGRQDVDQGWLSAVRLTADKCAADSRTRLVPRFHFEGWSAQRYAQLFGEGEGLSTRATALIGVIVDECTYGRIPFDRSNKMKFRVKKIEQICSFNSIENCYNSEILFIINNTIYLYLPYNRFKSVFALGNLAMFFSITN